MKLKLMMGVLFAATVASAETFTFTWDGMSASYGDGRVSVAYDGGSVAALTATVAEGDLVVFVGETPVSFAADATITVNGRGSLTFRNAAQALGALTFTSDAPRLSFDSKTPSLRAEDPAYLAFPDRRNLSDYILVPGGSSLYYNEKTQLNNLSCVFPERTATTYEYQGQADNGASTFCIFFRFVQQDDGIAIANAGACRATTGNLGADFRGDVAGKKWVSGDRIVRANLLAERVEGRREVTFENTFTAGGQITVADGVNLRGTAKAFKTADGGTFDLSVAFDNGSLTCLEFGQCNHAATISGTDGTVYYLTPDTASDAYSYTYEDTEIVGNEWGIPATDLVVLKNTALASVTGLTARIKWNQYKATGTGGAEQAPGADFTDNPTPMYFEVDPKDGLAVARFQMQRPQGGQAFSAPIVLTQVGSDVAVRKIRGMSEWYDGDARTWDPWRPNPGAHSYYTPEQFFITNLTFYTSEPIGGYAGTATFGTANSFGGTGISVVFRPGAKSSYRVNVTQCMALAPGNGHSVFEGVWMTMAVAVTASGGSLPWSNGIYDGSWGHDFTVYPGGRVQTFREKNNDPRQTVNVCGGEYGFTYPEPFDSKIKIDGGRLEYGTCDFDTELFDYVGSLKFSDGGRTFGQRPILGSQYSLSPSVTVTGTKPCRCDSGFRVASGGAGKLVTVTIDVANVTGDESVDFTAATVAFDAGVSVVKKGAGTVLFERQNSAPAGSPIRVTEGVIAMGCTDCFTTDAVFSLEGGSLTAAAGTVNTIGSLAVSESATLTLGDGSSLTVADPTVEWTRGAIVNVVGDPETCVLKFGDGKQDARRQVRALRWNGARCHMEEDGSIRLGGEGLVITIR